MVEALAVSDPHRARDVAVRETHRRASFADARLAGHEHKLPPAGARLVEGAGKVGQLNGASHETRRFGLFNRRGLAPP